MFESDRHFSHLSTVEREMAFRTEMGLYYSYYKTMIQAPSTWEGLEKIMYDNVTEFPNTINTLKRFNLYPEVVLGIAFQGYEYVMFLLNKPTKICYTVNRGDNLTPIVSCEGLGEPSYFYVECIFLLNGLNMSVFFIFGTFLSGSILGGILTVLSFFYNHGECTRVQWTPPLRENLAYPICVMQVLLVSYIIRLNRPSYRWSVLLAVVTTCFMLPWQFAQFALLTQTMAVFALYVLRFITSHTVRVVLLGQGAGLLSSYVMLFGNEMLLTSFFASCLISVSFVVGLEKCLEKLKYRIIIMGVQGVLFLLGCVLCKFVIARLFGAADDAHIFDLLRSKFTAFQNFHTMLYTCAVEFDFMEKETPIKLTKTLLLPAVFLVTSAFSIQVVRREWKQRSSQQNGFAVHEHGDESKSPQIHQSKPQVEVLYNILQCMAYAVMAILIMRLKLFFTPHLCVLASMLASRQLWSWCRPLYHHAVVVLIIAGMSVQGMANINHEWSIIGEYSNQPLEELVEWIGQKTAQDAVFAGPMPTMATVKLCTLRPIVNHPHYEDAGLRERTKRIYTMYSRKPLDEIWQNYHDLKVDYAIVEQSWCVRRPRPGCGLAEIWDLEDTLNRDKTPTCFTLRKKSKPYFKRVFQNSMYEVYEVAKK